MTKINLGDRCTDVVTGFKGIATGRCEYISGCVQILLLPKVKKDGAHRDGSWFDVERIEVLEINVVNVKSTPTGGPGHPSEIPPTR